MNPDYFLQLGTEPDAVSWIPVPFTAEFAPWGARMRDEQGTTLAAMTGPDAARLAVLFAHAPQMLCLLERIAIGRPLTVDLLTEINTLTSTVRQ